MGGWHSCVQIEGMHANFDDQSMHGRPFPRSRSVLFAKLVALPQPITIGRSNNACGQYMLNLREPSLRCVWREWDSARSIFVERKKTNDDRVVLFGKTKRGWLWVLEIKRKPSSTEAYVATISVEPKTFRNRSVHV